MAMAPTRGELTETATIRVAIVHGEATGVPNALASNLACIYEAVAGEYRIGVF
jgi:hypothetical protein